MLQTAKKIIRTKPRKFKTPEAHAAWIKQDDMASRLEDLARKADLIAWALTGVMALEDNDVALQRRNR
jgi:hypothetical protein